MSRKIQILRSCDRRDVLLWDAHVSGRKIDRRVLTVNVDAELGLTTCVWDRTSQSAQGFNLIPVDSAGEVWKMKKT